MFCLCLLTTEPKLAKARIEKFDKANQGPEESTYQTNSSLTRNGLHQFIFTT